MIEVGRRRRHGPSSRTHTDDISNHGQSVGGGTCRASGADTRGFAVIPR